MLFYEYVVLSGVFSGPHFYRKQKPKNTVNFYCMYLL